MKKGTKILVKLHEEGVQPATFIGHNNKEKTSSRVVFDDNAYNDKFLGHRDVHPSRITIK
jgi:hypothetical protein